MNSKRTYNAIETDKLGMRFVTATAFHLIQRATNIAYDLDINLDLAVDV